MKKKQKSFYDPEKAKKQREEMETQISEGIEKLFNELKEGRTDNLQAYFRTASKVRYSIKNLMLIFNSIPQATVLKTFDAWNKLGYYIIKDQHGVLIYQPKPYKKKVSKVVDGEEEEKVVSRMNYKLLRVYDISQVIKVDPSALDVKPNIIIEDNAVEQMDGDYTEFYQNVKSVIESTGIKVVEKRMVLYSLGVEGASYGGYMEIKNASSGNMLVASLHEWAHELLHQGSENKAYSKEYKECQAEAAAYVVCSALGIHSPFSKDYILGWGNTVEDFRKNLDMVIEASKKMLKEIDRFNSSSSSEDDEFEEIA